jgi:hypothetical protein
MNTIDQRNAGGATEAEIRAKKEKDSNPSAPYVMNNEVKALLNLRRLPARLNTAHTAACLGFKPHDIPVLVARGFLKPLGRPMPSSDKYFARARILERGEDEEWLSRATAALSQHWQNKNARKSKRSKGVTIRLNLPTTR